MDTGSISGSVVDGASQTPVGGARVTLVTIVEADDGATLGDDGRRTVTDANRGFVFQQLSSGRYSVDVEKSGFAPSSSRSSPGRWSSVRENRSPRIAWLSSAAASLPAGYMTVEAARCPK
jgi:hypothetical protein